MQNSNMQVPKEEENVNWSSCPMADLYKQTTSSESD